MPFHCTSVRLRLLLNPGMSSGTKIWLHVPDSLLSHVDTLFIGRTSAIGLFLNAIQVANYYGLGHCYLRIHLFQVLYILPVQSGRVDGKDMEMGILYGGILSWNSFPFEARVALSLIQVVLSFRPFVQQQFKMMMMMPKWSYELCPTLCPLQCPSIHVIKIEMLGSLATFANIATLQLPHPPISPPPPIYPLGHPAEWCSVVVVAGLKHGPWAFSNLR